jgi:FlgO protein
MCLRHPKIPKMKNTLILSLAVLALSGCSSLNLTNPFASSPFPADGSAPQAPVKSLNVSNEPFLAGVQLNTDDLVRQLHAHNLQRPIIVASGQNGERLGQVCPQGRLLGDIVSSRLTEHGLPVHDVRLAKNLRITEAGETILSRELGTLAGKASAETVIAATWSTLPSGKYLHYGHAYGAPDIRPVDGTTYVTLKAIRIADGRVLASQTFVPSSSWACAGR